MAQSAEQLSDHHASDGAGGHAHDAAHAEHPFLAHHFDNPKHQFESGKLGIWLFLVTEVLFFGGLFCAYAIYRSLHPEIFVYAHVYLSKFWGGVNTIILLLSSFTVALAVRSASLGDRSKTLVYLALTILGVITLGVGFLITLPIMLVVGIAALVLIIIAAMKANEGIRYRYPMTIRLIK